MSQGSLFSEVSEDPHHTGQWRLALIEIVNWGTFSGHTRIDVARRGHLFTGASGSGKSSLLDAIATVMTPDRWLRLNAAAQEGDSRLGDRTLMSYVRGAWTKEADEELDRAATVFLRPRATWGGILLRFENNSDEPITLARVFHAPGTRTETSSLKNARILQRGPLDLLELEPFVNSGIDARKMKAALGDALITTGNKHGRFHERVVRLFGFRSTITLHLLHKTQSAKNLGTLNALFRGFMLDQPETFDRANNAVEQFTELDLAHSHVVDLRRQAETLAEIEVAVRDYDDAEAARASADKLLDSLEPFTAARTLDLARESLGPAQATLAQREATRDNADRAAMVAENALRTAEALVNKEGGHRVELLNSQITTSKQHEDTIRDERARLSRELDILGAPMPATAAEFAELQGMARREVEREVAGVGYDIRDAAAQSRRTVTSLTKQIEALRKHRSNLDPLLLSAREMIAAELSLPTSALPFAGELIAVVPEHAQWRGAIERVLAPLARTLLVPEEHLRPARRAVNARHLGVRLVIESVPASQLPTRRPRDPRSLVHRIEISDSVFTDYVRQRLITSFDYSCVEHPDELDDVERGLTLSGLIKGASRRYIKDDRTEVNDPRRWVLGGDTEDRLESLITQLRQAEVIRKEAQDAEARADSVRDRALRHRDAYRRIIDLAWKQIDSHAAAEVTESYTRELEKITTQSSTLRDAEASRVRAEEDLWGAKGARDEAIARLSAARRDVHDLEETISELERHPQPDLEAGHIEELGEYFRRDRRSVTLKTISDVARSVQRQLSLTKERAVDRAAAAARRYTAGVTAFVGQWEAVVAVQELTLELADRYGYVDLREGIMSRGLPEKESKFRHLLRERSRDVVAHLLDDLRGAPAAVRERVLPVNAALAKSPFEGKDRFLEIDVKTTRATEVEEFLSDLLRIVEGNWAEETTKGTEERFAILKRVIGRLGSMERADRDWRNRVLDTRLHVSFLARERDGTGRVSRVYDSSAGLSGGQRQKLVIFCLAAALRYQMTDDEIDLPKFGSILLDEAFDKADSTYTRNAMDVFQAFGFHMILATPQKLLQTLEPYVGAITSVSNPEHNHSFLANVMYDPLLLQEPDGDGR